MGRMAMRCSGLPVALRVGEGRQIQVGAPPSNLLWIDVKVARAVLGAWCAASSHQFDVWGGHYDHYP